MKYKQMALEVDARQFLGGEKNGRELSSWVNHSGGKSEYKPENLFAGLKLPEELYVETPNGLDKLARTDWIIQMGRTSFLTCSDKEFRLRFEASR